jgi:DNA-directed RNA polymerase subunit beta'
VFELNNFDAIRIGLASPEKIREWSRGEVKNLKQLTTEH